MMKPLGRRRLSSPSIAKRSAEDMYMVLSWVRPVKLLSMYIRFIFQSHTTRPFICGRLFLLTYSLCLPLVVKLHSVSSIAKRAPGMVHPSCCISYTPVSLLVGNRSLRWSGRRASRQPYLHRSERWTVELPACCNRSFLNPH